MTQQPAVGAATPLLVSIVQVLSDLNLNVLDVLKSRAKLKISLSWSCLPDSLAAKFQSPGDLLVSFAASFVQSAPD